MATQDTLPGLGNVNLRQFDPVTAAQASARSYAEARGLSYDPDMAINARAVGAEGYSGYRATRDAIGKPLTEETRRSYEHLTREVGDQFHHMTSPVEQGGLGLSFSVSDTDPYDSPAAMARDITENRHIAVLSTAATGGHSVWDNETNDRFRAVHDVYGHAALGRDFSRDGEEAAFRSHAQMFTPEARAALASETRMQNTYLNWGGGDFPPNAPMNAPDWMTQINPELPAERRKIKSQGTQQGLPW